MCFGCGLAITGRYIESLDGHAFHSGCFRCYKCNAILQSQYLVAEEGITCPTPCERVASSQEDGQDRPVDPAIFSTLSPVMPKYYHAAPPSLHLDALSVPTNLPMYVPLSEEEVQVEIPLGIKHGKRVTFAAKVECSDGTVRKASSLVDSSDSESASDHPSLDEEDEDEVDSQAGCVSLASSVDSLRSAVDDLLAMTLAYYGL